jgi:phosphoadenosine phosphosulfate reductase
MSALNRAVARAGRAASLDAKLAAAKDMLAAASRQFGQGLWLAWTGGKDSTLLTWLARQASFEQACPMPRILTIDEGDEFPQLRAFKERLAREWDLECHVVGNAGLLNRHPAVGGYIAVDSLGPADREAVARLGFTGPGFPFDPDSPVGCQLLKIEPLADFLRHNRATALAVAIRRDEHPARGGETLVSLREDPPHTRLHPLLDFRERDVWDATLSRSIPFCELYRQGYRSLGTRSGSRPSAARPAWEQDLEHTPERAGRARDKEQAMAQLRSLGYM